MNDSFPLVVHHIMHETYNTLPIVDHEATSGVVCIGIPKM
jgi:hypothetical protein